MPASLATVTILKLPWLDRVHARESYPFELFESTLSASSIAVLGSSFTGHG